MAADLAAPGRTFRMLERARLLCLHGHRAIKVGYDAAYREAVGHTGCSRAVAVVRLDTPQAGRDRNAVELHSLSQRCAGRSPGHRARRKLGHCSRAKSRWRDEHWMVHAYLRAPAPARAR